MIYEAMDLPQEPFQQPPEIITLNICEDSGKIATNYCPNVDRNEVFKLKDHPTETCDLHPGIKRGDGNYRVVY